MTRTLSALAGLFATLLLASTTFAQGFLIVEPRPVPLPRPIFVPRPQPESSYKITELSLAGKIKEQVAQVQVTQSFVNTGSRQMEVTFVFPLPYDGAIDRLTFLVDGKEYEAKLMSAKEARQIYEGYIRRNQDPALLEYIDTGMFKTSVFPVPPGAERTVTLRYSQLLRKDRGLTDFLFPLSTAKYSDKPVEKVSLRLAIEGEREIRNIYSPTHSINTTKSDAKHAVVSFEAKNAIPTSDFRLFYDTGAGKLTTSLLSYRPDSSEDGYFAMLVSPEIASESAEQPKKDVVFVVDRSGSMSGKKIEQARAALTSVLSNLRDGDRFNIVAYDSTVESFRDGLVEYSEEVRKEAVGFVNGIFAGGGTNIDGALSKALAMVKSEKRPSYIVFLTDGRPTVGETNESKIVAAAKDANDSRVRLINFGVGYDVNSRLLDRLSSANFGKSEYVRPGEDIEAHVSKVYNKISSPVLSHVDVDFEFDAAEVEQGPPVNRTYPGQIHDVFQGEQLVVVGRYRLAGTAKVTITGKVGERSEKLQFPVEFTQHSPDETYGFVEKLWAMRRIGQIIDDIDLHGKNQELIDELVQLSTKHGILTPYTSFLADDQPQVGGPLANGNFRRRADMAFDRLEEAEGRAGFAQRDLKQQLRESAVAPQASGGGAFGAPAEPAAPGLGVVQNIDKDEAQAVETVQNVGNQTLYKRGKTWIAANAADIDLAKAKVEEIKRFSKEYFALVADNSKSENAVLARQQTGEELVIKLRGKVYRIQ